MRGIVWYKNKENGFEKMRSIMHGYNKMGINIIEVRRGKEEIIAVYENKDIWRCVPVSENRRGLKANVSLIERAIDKKLVNLIIYPATVASPYNAYSFYGKDCEDE